ncbi:MAG: porin, partial [Pseudomonadota bacterium]
VMSRMMKRTMLIAGMTMVSASAVNAADFEVGDDTTMSVFGSIEYKYTTIDKLDAQGDSESESEFADNGSVVGVGAEHRFDNGLTGFVVTEFEFDGLGEPADNNFYRDVAYAGLKGDFGEVRAGSFDNIYTVALYDLIDPFETTSLGEETVTSEDNQIAYYSPDFNGLSFELMTRVKGDGESGTGENDQGVAGVVKYTGNSWALHAGYDDRGSNDVDDPQNPGATVTQEPVYGVGGKLNLMDNLTLGARYSLAENLEGSSDGDETAFLGTSLNYDYGMGSVYGTVQEVEPDEGESNTQFAVGVNYSVVDNMYVYSEYGSYDPDDSAIGQDETEADTQYEVGAIYEF